MKNLHFAAIAAVTAAILAGCGNSTPVANLKNDIDTLSYSIGMAQTNGLKQYLSDRMGIDTAYVDPFVKGVKDGANVGDDKKKAAYYAGLQIGQQICKQIMPGINYQLFDDDSTKTISMRNFMAGFLTGVENKHGLMTREEAVMTAQMKMQTVKDSVINERYAPNKEEGDKFLAVNKKKPGVVTLPSGVQYKILKEGTGAIPADSSKVEVNYEGRLLNDTIFDSSYKRGKSQTFFVNRVIKGWSEALTHMPVGSEWEIYVPQELAYGKQKQAKIDPFSMLIFKVELLDIVDTDKNTKSK